MSAKPDRTTTVSLGFRSIRGGGVVVGLALEAGDPRIVLSSFIPTGTEGDPLSVEPYHVAAAMKRGPDGKPTAEAAAAVAEGRKRQDRLAERELKKIAGALRERNCEAVVATLLVNGAGWVSDVLEYSLGHPGHPPVAEGLAVRDALRFGIRQARIETVEMYEKSLPELASETLRLAPAAIDARLKVVGATAGQPWRKEQKLACLAAWISLRKLA